VSKPFYRGPQVESSKDGRFYVWKNRNYWSVTTIIGGGLPKPVLINWAKKFTAEYAVEHFEAFTALVKDDKRAAVDWLKGAAYRHRDQRGEIGTRIHDAAEAYVLDKPFPEWSAEDRPYMVAFQDWLADWQPTFTAVEVPVFNDTHRYAGTMDAIITLPDGQRLLIDYKTAEKGPFPEVALQLAAYRFAETFLGLPDGSEAPMPEVDGCAVVKLRPGGYEFYPVETSEDVFRSFLFCREVFRFTIETAKTVIGKPLALPDEALMRRLEQSVEATTP
jgi:hypothetical protein